MGGRGLKSPTSLTGRSRPVQTSGVDTPTPPSRPFRRVAGSTPRVGSRPVCVPTRVHRSRTVCRTRVLRRVCGGPGVGRPRPRPTEPPSRSCVRGEDGSRPCKEVGRGHPTPVDRWTPTPSGCRRVLVEGG